MKSVFVSWRTSVPAILAAVAAMARVWVPDQPDLVHRIEETTIVLGGLIAAFNARDHGVSSEVAGAAKALLVAASLVLLMPGCATPGGEMFANADGKVSSKGTGGSTLQWDGDIAQLHFIGERPTGAFVTPDGTETYGDTNFGTLTLMPDGTMTTTVPNDLAMNDVEIVLAEDGSKSVRLGSLTVTSSSVEAAQGEAIAEAMLPFLEQLPRAQLESIVNTWQSIGGLGESFAELARPLLAP